MTIEIRQIPMSPPLAEVVRRQRTDQWQRFKLILLVGAVIYLILLVMLLIGLLTGNADGPDFKVISIGFGLWLTLLLGLCTAVFGYRRRQLSNEIDRGICLTTRTKVKTWWLIRDSDSIDVEDEQYMRAKGIRGVLLVPREFHENFGPPREAELIYTPHSKVLLQLDGQSVWPNEWLS